MKIQPYRSISFILLTVRLVAQVPPPPQVIPTGPPPVLQQRPPVSYLGSVPGGKASAETINLTLRAALQLGLQHNFGILVNQDSAAVAAIERRRVLSALLPQFSAGVTQTSAQNNLTVFGFKAQGFPAIVGPFGYQNARAYAQQTVYDKSALRTLKSAEESQRAAKLSVDDARNLVVQAVSHAWLAVVTDSARVIAITAEAETARALFERATDRKNAGTVPGIDVLRAQVQLRNEQQRLLAQKNQVEKDKLALARAIGLASDQQFTVTGDLNATPLRPELGDLLRQAYDHRGDYRAAQANVRAAELAVQAASAERMPTVVVQADYGDLGSTFANSHGTYTFVAGVRIPIYSGGRSQTDIDQAMVALRTRKSAVEELRSRLDFELRNALLDLRSTEEQVAVAKENTELASQTLEQARDRFSAGVAENIEVIQAQQLLANANNNYIDSVNAHNSARISLATAAGLGEDGVLEYLGLKP